MHVEYRNSSYFGSFHDYQRHGYGLLVLDNSNIIMGIFWNYEGKWERGAINGNYAFSSDKIRAFGTMVSNKLEGFNVISTRDSIISMKNEP